MKRPRPSFFCTRHAIDATVRDVEPPRGAVGVGAGADADAGTDKAAVAHAAAPARPRRRDKAAVAHPAAPARLGHGGAGSLGRGLGTRHRATAPFSDAGSLGRAHAELDGHRRLRVVAAPRRRPPPPASSRPPPVAAASRRA